MAMRNLVDRLTRIDARMAAAREPFEITIAFIHPTNHCVVSELIVKDGKRERRHYQTRNRKA
jgi:hypothetical protein